MHVQDHHFVGVAEEADLLLGHFHGPVVYVRGVFDGGFELVEIELDLGVGHLDRDQLFGLLLELFFVTLEVFKFVCDLGSLDLFVRQLLEFLHAFDHVFFAEVNQTQVLLEVLLFAVNAHFLYFEGI